VATEWTNAGQTFVTPVTPERVIAVNHASLGNICAGACSPIYPVYGRDETTYAASISPLGVRAILLSRRRVQPTFESDLGVVISSRDIPVDSSSQFNYQFSFGPGVQFFFSQRTAVRLEYVFRHISNANAGAINPGIDQGVFRLTLSRYR
jgi:opacity protein-like surface antigen